jgi:hypothetical protein
MLCRPGLALAVLCGLLGVLVSSADAAAPHETAWEVLAATGPTHLPPVQSEIQEVTVGGEGGNFTLSHSLIEGTGTLNHSFGLQMSLTAGSDEGTFSSPGEAQSFKAGQIVTESEGKLPPETIIESVDFATGTLKFSAAALGTGEAFFFEAASEEITDVTAQFRVGDGIHGTGIPAATMVTDVGPTSITISKPPTAGGKDVILATTEVTTGPLPLGASAGQVQAALEGLSGYQPGTFDVSGGPGIDPGNAYLIAFGGSLADQEVSEFVASGSGLGEHGYAHVRTSLPGGAGTGTIAIFPTNIGGAASSGPITVDLGPLPAGVVTSGPAEGPSGWWTCTTELSKVECTAENVVKPLAPSAPIRVPIKVQLPLETTLEADVNVSGGGAGQSASYPLALEISPTPKGAGVAALYSKVLEADGSPSTQAGGHPYSQATIFALNSVRSTDGRIVPVGEVKDVDVDLQAGYVGSPLVTPRCPTGEPFICPYVGETDVGHLYPGVGGFGALGFEGQDEPFHNAVPVLGAAAQFSTKIAQPVATLLGRVRSNEDFGIRIESPDNSPFEEVYYLDTVFFGEPAGAGGKAFFRNATDCAAERQNPPQQSLAASSWQEPNHFDSRLVQVAAVEGCDKLHLEPAFELQPTSTQGSSGVGAVAHLHIDQSGLTDPNKLGTPDLKRSVVTLPAGFDVNPAQANGLEACSEAQVGYEMGKEPLPLNPTRFNEDPVTCPDASKLGTVEATSPLLEEPLKGTIYLAAQEENPFNSLIGVYLVFESERFGVTLKLPGKVETNEGTGQVTATFDYVPQQPIEDLSLNFRGGGPRSEFATPEVCGTYTTTGTWTPWSAPESGPPAQTSNSFIVSSGCSSSASTRPFHPSFEGGSVNPLAGSYTPLLIKINRNDGEQELTSLDFTLPPGESARLAGVPYCSDAAIAAAATKTGRAEQASPSCPAASQIGTVDAAAGVGSEPFHASGNVYLAGPYKGAPISAVVITPAVAGPFDLGDVVIRSPLFVDPETAQVTAKSDPIPTILRGIPLKIRSVAISIDRSGFSLNPTNCEAMLIAATVGSSGGASATPANRFQVGGCDKLAFKPKLQVSLEGSTKHAGHPALKAVLTYPKQGAYSNIARAQVNLPHSEFLDQGNLNKTCTKPVLLAGNCPKSTIYGKAKAWTPLLEKPLEGNVYLVGGYGYKLPALVAELNGQIRIVLKGKVDSGKNKGIRNTFEAVPDAPVSRFVLQLKGGKKYSLLENSENLCAQPQRAIARFTAQNGRVQQTKPLIANQCKKNTKKRHKKQKQHSQTKSEAHKNDARG